MKNLLLFLFIFLLSQSCKEKSNPCENGRYDEGEIGIDCGGNCADCVFDKNDIIEKTWKDVYPHSDLENTLVREHFYDLSDVFFANWTSPTIGTTPVGSPTKYWEWVNGSDTLQFDFNENLAPKRLILHVGEDFYKFKTDQDGWEHIYAADLMD